MTQEQIEGNKTYLVILHAPSPSGLAFKQMPGMKEPDQLNYLGFNCKTLYKRKVKEYRQHLGTLKIIDIALEYKERWKVGDIVSESEFFTVDTNKWFLAQCTKCGWYGSSKFMAGGGQIADSGDYEDPMCPKCLSSDVEEYKETGYNGIVAVPSIHTKNNQDKDTEAYKKLLKIANVPDILLQHPSLMFGNPVEKDIAWAKEKLEQYYAIPKAKEQEKESEFWLEVWQILVDAKYENRFTNLNEAMEKLQQHYHIAKK